MTLLCVIVIEPSLPSASERTSELRRAHRAAHAWLQLPAAARTERTEVASVLQVR